MAAWSHDACKKSPTGFHQEETGEIEVEKHGQKIPMIVSLCRWCGAQLEKPKRKRR